MVLSHCYLHGFATLIQDDTGNDHMTIEYSDLSDSRNLNGPNNGDHGNIWWWGSSYTVFRYNKVHNYNMEGLFMGWSTGRQHVNNEIYGNVFYDGVGAGGARGIEFRESEDSIPAQFTNIKIYNNTFYNMPLAAVRVMANVATSGCEFKNNLLGNASMSVENGGAGITEVNNIANATTVFMNYNSRNFHLGAPTQPGTVLPSPYNQDPDGLTRGAAGVWDIGAYEDRCSDQSCDSGFPRAVGFRPGGCRSKCHQRVHGAECRGRNAQRYRKRDNGLHELPPNCFGRNI